MQISTSCPKYHYLHYLCIYIAECARCAPGRAVPGEQRADQSGRGVLRHDPRRGGVGRQQQQQHCNSKGELRSDDQAAGKLGAHRAEIL